MQEYEKRWRARDIEWTALRMMNDVWAEESQDQWLENMSDDRLTILPISHRLGHCFVEKRNERAHKEGCDNRADADCCAERPANQDADEISSYADIFELPFGFSL